MNKTTLVSKAHLEALKLAEEALVMYCEHGAIFKPNETLAAIREALADHVEQSLTMVSDHSCDANEMVAEPVSNERLLEAAGTPRKPNL